MNERSQSVHKIDKRFVPNCFLHLIMQKKPSIFNPSAQIKICTLSKAPPPVWHIINTHTKQLKTSRLPYKFVLGPLHFQSYRSKQTFDLKNNNLRKDWHTLTQTNQNWVQFQKAQLTPYIASCAFSHSPPGQGVMFTNLLPVIATRMEPHSHLHKTRPTSLKSKHSTVPLPDIGVMIPVFQDGSAFPAHSQTFKPTPASFTYTNSQPLHSLSQKIFSSITTPQVERKWWLECRWQLHPKCKVSGTGGRPFCSAHNKALSRSTRSTHFQMMSKGTNLTFLYFFLSTWGVICRHRIKGKCYPYWFQFAAMIVFWLYESFLS